MLRFGDLVRYDLSRSHGAPPSEAYVIGEPTYSRDGGQVMLAKADVAGMPISADHCGLVESGNYETCRHLRDRYEAWFPGRLKPLE